MSAAPTWPPNPNAERERADKAEAELAALRNPEATADNDEDDTA